MVPRPVVVIVVLVLLAILSADVGAQFVVEGHSASPMLGVSIIGLIGAIITGAKGPRPDDTPESDEQPTLTVNYRPSGRHQQQHRSEDHPS